MTLALECTHHTIKKVDPQILAGNEISLAMLEIDATTYATKTDRQQAMWTAYDEVRQRFGLSSLMQVRLCKRVSERYANQPMMLHLFDFRELSAICTLGVSDAQMRELAEERRGNPSFGLAGILKAVRRFER